MQRLTVGPFNRVEGDLEVHLEVRAQRVESARVNSPLFRGFEKILEGKDPRDALVYAPRICGICSVSQSVAAARALAQLQRLEMPPNGELAHNIILATENIADHISHFYLFFMPDFARAVYARRPWHEAIGSCFRAMEGRSAKQALQARAELLQTMGILAGKWPHSLALQPGGTTRSLEHGELLRLQAVVDGFRRFAEDYLFADTLERVVDLADGEALEAWRAERPWEEGDLRRFLHVADDLCLDTLGRAQDRFISYGAYAHGDAHLFASGVRSPDGRVPLDVAAVAEDVSHSWMAGKRARHPSEGRTDIDESKSDAYSWCKAPRLNGQACEVGALARQYVDGHPLIEALVRESGGNVRNRVVARLLEVARLVVALEQWLARLTLDEAFCAHASLPDEGQGAGLVEAARGSLGHWLRVEQGRIANYQIISPTTWNFSPRDGDNRTGPLEEALVGAPIYEGETDPVTVQHIVRSFDPCMVCTVH